MTISVEAFISQKLEKPGLSAQDESYWRTELAGVQKLKSKGLDPQVQRAVLSEGKFHTGFDITRLFFRRARDLGVDKTVLKNVKGTNRRVRFASGLDITERYLETDATLGEMGSNLGISGEGVRQTVNRTRDHLVSASPESLRKTFLQDELKRHKPLSMRIRQKLSEVHGGRSLAILELTRQGIPPREIVRQLKEGGVSTSALIQARKTLAGWGEEFGYINTGVEIRNMLSNPDLVDQQIQQALDQIRRGSYHGLARGKEALILPVSRLVRGCGYHFRSNKLKVFVEKFKESGVPVGEISYRVLGGKQVGSIQMYHFIAAMHKDRGIKILSEADDLRVFRQNPVRQLFGPSAKRLPNTTQLICRRGFESLSRAFYEVGIKTSSNQFRKFLGEDCPAQIFQCNGALYVYTQDWEGLISYLRSRLSQDTSDRV